MNKSGLADMLERFVGDGPGYGKWEWDDFTSVRAEPELEPYRQYLLIEATPPGNEAKVRQIIARLRADASK